MSGLLIYGLFYASCLVALINPWIGITAFYGFYFLNPEWNWRWEIPRDSGFQKWLLICTLIGFLIQGFRGQEYRKLIGFGIVSLVGYLGISYLSANQSIDPGLSGFYMEIIWKVVFTTILAIRLLDTPRKLMIFMWIVVLAHGYNSYQINKSYFDIGFSIYVYRTNWAWTGSNQWSNKTLCVTAIAIALVFYSRKKWQSALAGCLALMMCHEIMLLESRGVMLGALVTGFVVFYFVPKTRLNNSLFVLGLIGVFSLAGPSVVGEFTSSFAEEEQMDASAASRFELWRAGYQIMINNPVLGVGPYAASRLVPQYLSIEGTNKGLHNLWFEIACGSGIIAGILFFNFFLMSMISSWIVMKSKLIKPAIEERAAAMACISGLCGFLVCNMFSAGALVEGSYVLALIGASGYLLYSSRVGQEALESNTDEVSVTEADDQWFEEEDGGPNPLESDVFLARSS